MNNNILPTGNGTSVGKKKRKFNIIDFLILLLILALIAALVYAFSPLSQFKKLWTTNEVKFQYQVELKNVDSQFKDLIKPNDSVYDPVTKNSLGKVIKIDNTQSSSDLGYEMTTNGEPEGKFVPINGEYDIVIVIETTANFEEGIGYTVNGSRVAVGEKLHLRFPNYFGDGYGYCTSIVAS